MTVRTNREFVMLSSVLNKSKHRIGGMYCSEKLDGMRAIWIPAARNRPVDSIPFANIEKDKKIPHATGLFSRYGKIIYAPNSFLDGLPNDRCLDGELWMGRQSFQRTMKTVKKHEPIESEWSRVKFHVFDSPAYGKLFQDGRINNPNFKKQMSLSHCLIQLGIDDAGNQLGFEQTYNLLKKESKTDSNGIDYLFGTDNIVLHKQELLPFITSNADARLEEIFREITDEGGEGLMLRHPSWEWEPFRSNWLFKYKPDKDAEGKVIGYVAGKGKHESRLGSIRLLYNGLQFDLGGFTDEERDLNQAGKDWASKHVGEYTTEPISTKFPVGSIINFRFRELTETGVPKEARYARIKVEE